MMKQADLVFYLCANEKEFNDISNEMIDIQEIRNINKIKIGQNIFDDERYNIQLEYREKSFYVIFDEFDEEEFDMKGSFIRLFFQIDSFLDICLYEKNIQKKTLLKRFFLKYIKWRFQRLLDSNIFLTDKTLLKELDKQPILDDFLNYRTV